MRYLEKQFAPCRGNHVRGGCSAEPCFLGFSKKHEVSLDILDCVVRFSSGRLSTSSTASRTALILQRRQRMLTIGPGDAAFPSECTHETNEELNCTLIYACLEDGCCSVCFRCRVVSELPLSLMYAQSHLAVGMVSSSFTLDRC